MSTTKHLNLIKPSSGTKNWGHALNNNFETLDNHYAALANQVNALRRQMGQLGIYFYDPTYDSALIAKIGANNEVEEAYLNESESQNKLIIYNATSGFNNLNKLIDYSMFIFKAIKSDVEYTGKIIWNGYDWYSGDIAVKMTQYNDLTNENILTIVRMQQTIGGFYQPTRYTLSSKGLPVAHFDRKNALDSVPVYEGPSLYIKPTEVVGNSVKFSYYTTTPGGSSERSLGIAATVSYPQVTTQAITYVLDDDEIDTRINSNDYIITDVQFYKNGAFVICGYEIEKSDTYIIWTENLSRYKFDMVVSYAPRGQLSV